MGDRIKGILFDLGDTLLDFGSVDVRVMFESGAKLAYEYLRDLGLPLPPFARYHRRQLMAVRWSYLRSRLTRREFNALDLIGRLSMRMGHDLTDAQMAELAWLWYEPLSRCASVEPGVREMLADLRDRGMRLGLLSNTFVPGAVLDRHLRRERLLEYLPVRVYSCDVKYRKPNANAFRIALERMGLEARETMFVGDSPQADIDGANRAGMITVLKDPQGRHADHQIRPWHTVVRVTEVGEVLSRYHDEG